jgi:hypothetical protein
VIESCAASIGCRASMSCAHPRRQHSARHGAACSDPRCVCDVHIASDVMHLQDADGCLLTKIPLERNRLYVLDGNIAQPVYLLAQGQEVAHAAGPSQLPSNQEDGESRLGSRNASDRSCGSAL